MPKPLLRQLTRHTAFRLLLCLLLGQLAHAEILIVDGEHELQGQLGSVRQNAVPFTGSQEFMFPLKRVSDVRVDPGVTGAELARQQKLRDALLRLIDQSAYQRQVLERQVRDWLLREEFEELEQHAALLLSEQQRLANGAWRLHYFYTAITNDLKFSDVAGARARVALVEAWRERFPHSDTPRIAQLHAWQRLARALRSQDNAYERYVTESQNLAVELLRSKPKDPVAYSKSLDILNPALDYEVENILTAAQRVAPGYHSPFLVAMFKARGYVERMQQTASWAKSLASDVHRAEFYYRLVVRLLESRGIQEFGRYQFEWALVQEGFRDFRSRYQDTDADAHNMALLARYFDDRASFKRYIALTHADWNPMAADVWNAESELIAARKWSQSRPTQAPVALALRAIAAKDAAALGEYINAGGDPNASDMTGRPLLIQAALARSSTLLQTLLDGGAVPDIQDSYGWQAIHYAARKGDLATVQMLNEGGAALDAVTARGHTPMLLAAGARDALLVEWLLDFAPDTATQVDDQGTTPLIRAVRRGRAANVARLVLQVGTDINHQDMVGSTALHHAAIQGDTKSASFLLAAGADHRILNKNGNSILALAMNNDNKDFIAMLKRKGLDDIRGSRAEQWRAAKVFIDAGAAAYHAKNYELAKLHYRDAAKAYPDLPNPYHGQALVEWTHKGNLEGAIVLLEKAISVDPKYAESYYVAGRISFEQGNTEAYLRYFRAYLKLAPDTFNARELLRRIPDLAGS